MACNSPPPNVSFSWSSTPTLIDHAKSCFFSSAVIHPLTVRNVCLKGSQDECASQLTRDIVQLLRTKWYHSAPPPFFFTWADLSTKKEQRKREKKSLIPVFRNTAVSKKKKRTKGRFFHSLRDQGKRTVRNADFHTDDDGKCSVCSFVKDGSKQKESPGRILHGRFSLFVVEPHTHLFWFQTDGVARVMVFINLRMDKFWHVTLWGEWRKRKVRILFIQSAIGGHVYHSLCNVNESWLTIMWSFPLLCLSLLLSSRSGAEISFRCAQRSLKCILVFLYKGNLFLAPFSFAFLPSLSFSAFLSSFDCIFYFYNYFYTAIYT